MTKRPVSDEIISHPEIISLQREWSQGLQKVIDWLEGYKGIAKDVNWKNADPLFSVELPGMLLEEVLAQLQDLSSSRVDEEGCLEIGVKVGGTDLTALLVKDENDVLSGVIGEPSNVKDPWRLMLHN